MDREREADMRKQHKEFERSGYNGHNIRSGLTTMHDLNTRRLRRVWNERMKTIVKVWNHPDDVIDYSGSGKSEV